jgi:hypothetical protein
VKRRGRADEVLAAVRAPAFQRQLAARIRSKGGAVTSREVRAMATEELAAQKVSLDGVAVTFRWDADRQRVEVKVKGASTPVDAQAGVS